jgi:VWFA-related protein
VRLSSPVAAIVSTTLVFGLCAWPYAQTPTPPSAPTQQPSAPPTQQTQPADQRPPTFRTEANFVRVDTYPTRGGKPVTDLAAADFEVLEDGVLQKIESFEHVVVRPAGPQSNAIEPSSQREMLQAAANPRNRVFVIFLDGPHVSVDGSHNIAEPLIRLINRILGPDDLVGIMTPRMTVSDVVLSRRSQVTEEQLRKHWVWGERFGFQKDEREQAYDDCYPPMPNEASVESALARELIERKRERVTLEALQDLVRYLNGVREERKAILTVTEGWRLFKPDPSLEKLRKDPVTGSEDPIPGLDPIRVGPDGKLTTRDTRNIRPVSKTECDADRQRLAAMDDEMFLRDIINDANRSNSSFYPIDPRGLVAFDTPINQGLSLQADARSLRTRQDAMRTLAGATDGLAVMDSNDLDNGLRKISDDLTSYYLLGYYSTNGKLDGGYRQLKVRVKRPGVDVRARRGYRAASADEIARARKGAEAPAVNAATPVQSALSMLAEIRPDARIRLRATSVPGSDLVWIAGELSASPGRADEWSQGATAALQISSGGASTGSRVTVKGGDRTFLTSVKIAAQKDASIDVLARVSSTDSTSAAVTEGIHIPSTPQPLFYRRGPSTANRQVVTADLRFTRGDRAHLELPVALEVKPGSGRLLDRAGQPLAVPVTIGERTDDVTGQHWITADVTLAPLAPGDYVIELGTVEKSGEMRVVSGIRVVR